ncbi:MAG TPA: hypothetical protein VF528_11140 [Pyrinomonadaceae bacterium]
MTRTEAVFTTGRHDAALLAKRTRVTYSLSLTETDWPNDVCVPREAWRKRLQDIRVGCWI